MSDISGWYLAYFDPGTGSILLQLLISSILGAGVFFRHSLWRVVQLFRRSPGSELGESPSDEAARSAPR